AASAKAVTVIPATSVPAGLAAAAAFNPVSSREENERAMRDAAEGTTSIELTVAARDAVTAGGRVERGAWIAMADGDVVEVGSDPVELAAKSVARMRSDDHEILTVFVGRDPTDEEAAKFAAELRDAAAGLGVETHRGGQPHYR